MPGFADYLDPITKHSMINKPPMTEEEKAVTPDSPKAFKDKVRSRYAISEKKLKEAEELKKHLKG